jgi:MFS family permease
MLNALRSTWALLLGIGLLMLGHGLQGTLLSVRATADGFATATTGIVMSGYFTGLIAGSLLTPVLVARVGHVRVFGALASIASTAVLIHALYVHPLVWFLMRFVTGICFCAAFIVAESWLNEKASNANRGQVFAIYMVVQLGGVALGQFLLNLADPEGYPLFVLVSVLVSLAVVPILLSASPAPPIVPRTAVGLVDLFRVSPLGVVGIVAIGLTQAALYAMGPVYARTSGLSLAGISTFMATAILGGVVLQWPVGRLSDLFDRRTVITAVTMLAGIVVAGALFIGGGSPVLLMVLFFLFGGLSLPLYSLCVAHINDFLAPAQMVGASSALLLANGLGAAFGPSLAAFTMSGVGAAGFPLFLAAAHLAVGGFALWRMTRRAAPPLEAQGRAILLPAAPSPVATAVAQRESLAQRAEAAPALRPEAA